MRKETLLGVGSLLAVGALSSAAFSYDQRVKIRQQRGQVRLEVHHLEPSYRGGPDSEENAVAMSLPEHALAHLVLARKAQNSTDKDANMWALEEIKKRMSPEERKVYDSIAKA